MVIIEQALRQVRRHLRQERAAALAARCRLKDRLPPPGRKPRQRPTDMEPRQRRIERLLVLLDQALDAIEAPIAISITAKEPVAEPYVLAFIE